MGIKYVCPVWIRPTGNFLTHLMTTLRINECGYNKYNTHKSKINKIRLEQRTWWLFYIKQSNQLKQTSLNTQPPPSSWPSTNLWGKKIRISGLDTAYRKFSNTPKDKFQDQWTLIRLIRTNSSTTNGKNMIAKTPMKNTWQIINQRNNNNLYHLNCSSIN